MREMSRDRRTLQLVSALGVRLECDRSDPSSGLVANPFLGLATDWLIDAGGWAVLGETLEWLGAESLFTTGVGNPYVSALAPTIKLSANPDTCRALADQLDFDTSAAFTGQSSLHDMSTALCRQLLAVASGEATWGKITGEGDEVLSRFGQAL